MAVTSAPQPMTVTTEERTWRATLESPKGGPYSLTIHREKRTYDGDGNPIGERVDLPAIVLDATTIAAETIAVGDNTYSVAELQGVLAAYFDQKASELAE